MYGCGRTLFENQQLAQETPSFRWMTSISAAPFSESRAKRSPGSPGKDQLLLFARYWLYERPLSIIHDRALRAQIAAALVQLEGETGKAIASAVPPELLDKWRITMG
jgi:hypothetical protein